MRTKLIKIGNSRGIRLPKAIIDQVRLGNEIELQVFGDEIVIRPANRKPREGWAESFRAMAETGDNVLPDWPQTSLTKFDDEEWEW
jgi:antitoxin MazE